MNNAPVQITKELFDQVAWQNLLISSQDKSCAAYHRIFTEQLRESESKSDERASMVFRLLGSAASLLIRLEHPEQPFYPFIVFENGRSPALEDFTEEHIAIFKLLAPETQDAEMRARLADVVWVRQNDFGIADIAVNAYLESAQILESPTKWTAGTERIERALQISVRYGRNGPYFPIVIQYIESLLDRFDGNDPNWFSGRLMQFLLDHSQGDSQKYAALSERMAQQAQSTRQWLRARGLWEINARWHGVSNDEEAKRRSLLLAAQTHEFEAQDAIGQTPSQFLVACRHIEEAIEAYRRIGNHSTEIERLKNTLLGFQQKAADEMHESSFTIDATETVRQARMAVKKDSISDSLQALSMISRVPQYSLLQEEIESRIAKYPFVNMLNIDLVNMYGRRVGTRPAANPNNSAEANHEFVRVEMLREASNQRLLIGGTIVLPAIDQINSNYQVRASDFYDIVHYSPFVQPDREMIYLKGLCAGIEKDFLTSSHLLIPQIEQSVRHILSQKGVNTTGYDAEGVQDELLLGKLLYLPEMEKVFGQDLTFDLQGLLVEKMGDNLRNELSHGLIPQGDFYTNPSHVYLWWLALHLCYLPLIAMQQAVQVKADKTPDDTTSNKDTG